MGRWGLLVAVLGVVLGGCAGARVAGGGEPACELPVLTRSERSCEPCRLGCWDETLCRGHWTARGGLAWLRSTATTEFLDRPGDHVGVYAGVGYEWDITPRFTTGPELSLYLVARESDTSIQAVPQLAWHFLLNL